LLGLLGGELKTLPNSLLIEGHTDSTPYSSDTGYSNWELSADRANAARRILQQDGVRLNQVTQIRGYADQMLRIQGKPLDPGNRRISILVKNQEGVAAAVKQGQAVGKETSSAGPPAQSGSPKGAVPSPAAGQAAKPAASQGKH
jgi:chemotaxis protein MotB